MFNTGWYVSLLLSAVVLSSGCVKEPKQAYTVEQIPRIKDLEELMRVQAHTIDPWFARSDQTGFTDKDYDALIRAARTLKATTAAVRYRFSRDHTPDFTSHASQLEADAIQLETAAQSKAAAEIGPSLQAIRATCRSCHKQFK
jgi:hypothetical protein